MNCKELVYMLGDYVEGSMEDPLRQELSVHLGKCEPCMNFLKTYDKTRILCRQIRPEEIPEEVRLRLKAFIMEQVREHHGNIDKYMELAARERRNEVEGLLRAFAAHRLSPSMELLFRAHRDRCEKCGGFLRSINGSGEAGVLPEISSEIEEHIAEFIDALPPGEVPTIP